MSGPGEDGQAVGQFLGVVGWHIRVLEQAARRALNEQVQQRWANIVAWEGPDRVTSQAMGCLVGAERAGREQIRERSMFLLLMEAAMSRREQSRLPEQQGKGGVDPQTREGGGTKTPQGTKCC